MQSIHYDMEDLIEQANEVQESLGRSYGVPEEVDEADLQAGLSPCLMPARHVSSPDDAELDALGDDLGLEESEGVPSYLNSAQATTELPDFVDEAPTAEVRVLLSSTGPAG